MTTTPIPLNHVRDDHEITGDADERMRRVVARHLCGWISGHHAPNDHFLADADLVLSDVRAAGIRVVSEDAGSKHPRQPTHVDEHGVKRFVPNTVIEWLCDTGRLDLNEIHRLDFPVEDLRQLAQLTGWSVSGYYDLSYAEDCDE
jgi:hypothetical protein